jgi:7,8-dihydropterin-6-yl-methyl-4-(beta-D-ribofuranosyl)aminobenzene 5'-phosphate synthase
MEHTSKARAVTIVYDNRAIRRGITAAWGFASLIEGLEKTVLFDTGSDAPTLLGNMRELDVTPDIVDVVVLSHAHDDHAGGMEGFLAENSDVTVYLLESFPGTLKSTAELHGARVVELTEPTEVCEGAILTGEMVGESGIPEQSLVLTGDGGSAVVTGCAHPGIVSIVDEVTAVTGAPVRLVLGGFHLFKEADTTIVEVVSRLKKLGVSYAAPCHCSGERAIELFSESYGSRFWSCSAGTVIEIGQLIRDPHKPGDD